MKTFNRLLVIVFSLTISSLFISCDKDDTIENGYEEIGFDCLPDPDGTKISTCTSWGKKSDYKTMTTEAVGDIRCDDNNIMYSSYYEYGADGHIYIVGRVAGLAAIDSIPTDESVWQEEASVVPGYGYIVRCFNTTTQEYVYGRLYCIYSEGTVGGEGSRIVNVFKHQSPFMP